MESILKTTMLDQLKQIEAKKEEILKVRLQELNISVDEIMQERRFPLIVTEKDDKGAETIYYNDGSKYGIRVITFYPLEFNNPTCVTEGGKYKFEMSFKYR